MNHTVQDDMVVCIRENPDGVRSAALAERFLKFKSPDNNLAHLTVKSILGKDNRCSFGNDNLWHASAAAPLSGTVSLHDIPWAAVYLLAGQDQSASLVHHISIWSVFPSPELLLSEWISDPDQLPYEEQITLRSPADKPFNRAALPAVALAIAQKLSERMPVFLSWKQQSLLGRHLLSAGHAVSDDTLLMSQLFAAAGVPCPQPISLDSCYSSVLGAGFAPGYAYKHGEALAMCAGSLFDRLISLGISTRADLDEREKKAVAPDLSGKAFSYDDLMNLPELPGVYGFKNKTDAFIYIGKAKNMKRRLLGYFRPSDESPEKLQALRAEAHSLVTFRTGSELECLIYEYRLIKKHTPTLNTQTEISERKGAWSQPPDSIVLLPHAQDDMGMSLWIRKNQKIKLRQFSTKFEKPDSDRIIGELEEFFFPKKLPADTTDFPEMEIALRWIQQHRDEITAIPAHTMGAATELYEAIRTYWPETGKVGASA